MSEKRFGELPPRHSFILNPYNDLRLSKCPKCDRPTHMRKFALLVVIDEFGTIVLGKTCRFCTPCDLLMVHQDELEHELVIALEPRAPEVIGNDYMAFGTVDKKFWRKSLKSGGHGMADLLAHAADFKEELNLEYDPGGWRPAPEKV